MQRRLETLLQLSDETPRALQISAYWNAVKAVLSRNEKDITFALLYSLEIEDNIPGHATPAWTEAKNRCVLRGSVGMNEETLHSCLAVNVDDGFMPYFRQASVAHEPIIVQFDEDQASIQLVQGLQERGFGDPCRAAAVCTVRTTSNIQNALGFLVIGLNSRTPYDDNYQRFVRVMTRLLSGSLESILLHEEDVSRQQRANAYAESVKLQLTEKLLVTQKELERSILKFQRFAERADIGIFIVGADGVYSYRNPAWYDILAPKDREIVLSNAWNELIDDDYISAGQETFARLMEEKTHQ